MKILITIGHPNLLSFNHALAKTVTDTLTDMGHTTIFHDLYQEKFNPVLQAGEMQDLTDPQVRLYTEELSNADGLVIIHPIWWGLPPAVIAGWVDRVFRISVAYQFKEVSPGVGVPVGLLKAKKSSCI